VPARYLSQTFDVLSDISVYPKLMKKDLDKEKTVILEEIKMYHDLPQYYVGELLEALLWPDHPLGQSLAGSMKTVSEMNVSDLKDFHQHFYSAQNIVVSACGNVKHNALVEMVQKKLHALKASQAMTYLPARKDQHKPAVNLYYKDTEQMHLALGYLAYENNHPDYYALALLSIILGGNMSSRLFTEVREKRGLAYSVNTGLKSLDDTGVFIVRAGVDNTKIVPAVELILKVLSSVTRRIDADEFKRAKEYYMGQFSLGLEDTMDHMIWMGAVVLSNDQAKTPEMVIERISKVQIKDVIRVAKQVLDPKRLNMAIIGPMTEEQQKQLKTLVDKP
jgi:predicted Zn-dependent peptidase